MDLCLCEMLDKRVLERLVLGGIAHLRQRVDDLVFGEVDVLQRIVKKHVQCLDVLDHDGSCCSRAHCPVPGDAPGRAGCP
ncbi:hypothetical protein D9M68_923650 [compost metagenome]